MTGYRTRLFLILLLPLMLTQCRFFGKSEAEPVSIQRFEVDFYNTDTTRFAEELELLAANYPNFYPVFVEGVLNIAINYADYDSYLPLMYEFRTHPSMLGLRDSIVVHYPDMSSYERAFTDALGRYISEFPDREQPQVVTFVSEFGNKAILYDGGLGISLDMFLGKQYPYYDGIGMPLFIKEFLTADAILPNAMRVLAEDHVRFPDAEATMLERIVYEGKKLYFAKTMLPRTPSNLIIEYNEDQYSWCLDNEANIWGHLVESEILYSQKYTEYNRYVDPSPTTYGLPAEAPGRLGIWVGWRIVESYMDRRSGTSLKKLMEELDARTILEDSGYRPR